MFKRDYLFLIILASALIGGISLMFVHQTFFFSKFELWDFILFLTASLIGAFLIRKYILHNETELKLKQSQESLSFALQSGRMGTWDINLVDDTVNCSKEMLELWNVTEAEITGDRIVLQSKVHKDDLQKMKDAIDDAIIKGKVYELEYRIHPIPGVERWVLSRGRCTFHPETKKAVRFSGVVFDITEKKIQEATLALALKARDQFFMIASHELKTPLTCMQLQNQVTEWDLGHHFPEAFTKEKIESGLRRQNDQLLRLTRIVDNILDETKISEGRLSLQYEHFELNRMVSDVLTRFRPVLDAADVDVTVKNDESVYGLWDKYRLEQVLLNLLINAIRYGNKKPVHIEIKQEKHHAFINVKDFGIGIRTEDQDRIFDRFERLAPESDKSGMGLGLFISRNIVHAHGGEIHLKSEFGSGSEFIVVLPLKQS